MKKNIKLKAFGAIDLLIGLVIISFIFLISMNVFRGTSSLKINNSSVNQQSVQEHVDETVNEIENMRRQTIEYNNQMLQKNY